MIKLRQIEKDDLDIVLSLYAKFPDFQAPNIKMLPGEGLDGLVALKDDKIVAACYLYLPHNAPTCWIEWVVADRDYKQDDKHHIVKNLIEYAGEVVKEVGYLWLMSMVTNKALENIHIDAGFEAFSSGKELIKTL